MIWKKALELEDSGTSFVTVTLTSVIGSAPQNVGSKIIVTQEGLYSGTVGGGKVEAACIKKSLETLNSQKYSPPYITTWNLQKDIKMTCGGVVTFLFEHFPANTWQIAIFGAGHLAQVVSRTLSRLKCTVTVIDERQEWVSKLEGVKTICPNSAREVVKTFDKNTFFLSMTKGSATDLPILHEIFKRFPDAPYVGVVGSECKGKILKEDLRKLDVTKSFLDTLYIPIGLPIGSNDLEEISISVAAQLIQVRDQLNNSSTP